MSFEAYPNMKQLKQVELRKKESDDYPAARRGFAANDERPERGAGTAPLKSMEAAMKR